MWSAHCIPGRWGLSPVPDAEDGLSDDRRGPCDQIASAEPHVLSGMPRESKREEHRTSGLDKEGELKSTGMEAAYGVHTCPEGISQARCQRVRSTSLFSASQPLTLPPPAKNAELSRKQVDMSLNSFSYFQPSAARTEIDAGLRLIDSLGFPCQKRGVRFDRSTTTQCTEVDHPSCSRTMYRRQRKNQAPRERSACGKTMPCSENLA